MRLRDIMKPYKDSPGPAMTLGPDTDVADIDAAALPLGVDCVHVGVPGREPVGMIARSVLVYVAEKFRLATIAAIVDHLEEGVVAMDAESRIFYANQTYTRLLGVPLGKIIGKRMRDIEANAAMLEVLETRRPLVREKTYIETIDRYVSVRIFPIYRNGTFEGVASIFKDVTELNSLNREISRITRVAHAFQNQIEARDKLNDFNLIGTHPRFAKAIEQALLVAGTDATVLLQGENGTGKEILAKLIRSHSLRSDKPFVAVNCAAVPDMLIESELFGYEDGSFTGAKKGGRAGKFQLADGGTLFLDEVGDMPHAMQGKLLRFLQDGESERLGTTRQPPLDVRVIAATNQPLEEMIAANAFRRDLYYRLNVFSIHIPPLREREHDVLLLANHFLDHFHQRYGNRLELTRDVYDRMAAYHWPGNVRELKNYIERSVILSVWSEVGGETPAYTLSPSARSGDGNSDPFPTGTYADAVRDFEKRLLSSTLRRNANNKTAAMNELGMSRRTFYRKLKDADLL